MSIVSKLGASWHPLARLNLFISLFFFIFFGCTAISLLLMPGTIDTRIAQILLAIGWVWWITIFFSTVWVFWNALSLSISAYQSRHINPIRPRHLYRAWLAPIILILLIFMWQPLVGSITRYRSQKSFDESRSDFLIVCDRVLDEGLSSASIRDDIELGVFKNVDVLYQDNIVFFNIGDNLRTYGYACIEEGRYVPNKNDIYEFDKIDSRFYSFSEIENRLTPQPDTPTPEITPESGIE